MPLPGDLSTVVIQGTFTDSAGNPVGGQVYFTPSAPLTDPTGLLVIPMVTRSYLLQGGKFTTEPLVATDCPDLSPAGWAYEVVVAIENIAQYSFATFLPSSPSTVDFSALEPVYPAGTVLGPAGYLPTSGGTETGTLVLDGTPPLKVPGATSGQALVSDGSGNFTPQVVPAGNASSVDGVTVSGITASGRVIMATDATHATWQLPLQVDTTASDIKALAGSAAAGSLTQAAAADHVHPSTGLVTTAALPLAIAAGGTGSGTQNFADLTTNQTIAGVKTFSGEVAVPAPVNSSDAVTKAYADAISTGLQVKPAARAATTGSETFTISSGHVTQINGTTLDATVSPQIGDLVLVKDAPASSGTGSVRSSVPANGLYSVTGNTTNLSVSRASAMSGGNSPVGAFVFTTGGATNAGAGYVVTTPASGAFTYDSGNIQWAQFSATGSVTAGTGLTQAGSVISLTTPVAAASLPAATTSTQGAIILDGTAGDIAALAASASAGSTGQAADAGHVHPSTGLVLSSSLPLAIGSGGTGQATQQAALDALAGGTTSTQYLRGNGTHVTMSAIQAGDVPTLNQSTTGTAAGLSSTLAVGSGGTGQTSAQAALDALAGAATAGSYLRGNGTHVVMNTIQAADLPAGTTGTQGALQLDGTSADIAASGIQAAGVSTKAAAADHVHPLKSWSSLYVAPSGATAETYPRMMCTASQTPVSGRLQANAIALPAGLAIAHLTFCTGSAAVSGLSHGWYVLLDNTYKVLAATGDQTSGVWGSAATLYPLALSFTTTYTGLYYAGWMINATTVTNTMAGSPSMSNGTTGASPVLCGVNGTTGTFTTPPSNGTTLTLTSSAFWSLYAYTS